MANEINAQASKLLEGKHVFDTTRQQGTVSKPYQNPICGGGWGC